MAPGTHHAAPHCIRLAVQLEEGERRLELALHYGIAYPRLHHSDQFEKARQPVALQGRCSLAGRGRRVHTSWLCCQTAVKTCCPARRSSWQVPYFQAPQLEAADEPEKLASGVRDRSVAQKLAAAARRRRERQAQQQRQAGQQQQEPGGDE